MFENPLRRWGTDDSLLLMRLLLLLLLLLLLQVMRVFSRLDHVVGTGFLGGGHRATGDNSRQRRRGCLVICGCGWPPSSPLFKFLGAFVRGDSSPAASTRALHVGCTERGVRARVSARVSHSADAPCQKKKILRESKCFQWVLSLLS